MRLRNAIFAIAVAAIALAALPASALESTGYLRSGIGGNFRGGGQVCFYLPGTDFKWRLGNECETYAELGFRETLYKDRSGVEMVWTGMLSYSTQQRQDYESLTGNGNDIANRQNFISFKNLPFLGGATAWGGKRYYMRNDVHAIDWYYFDPSGPGVGIEDFNVSDLFKGAVAAFQNRYGDGKQIWRLDIRAYELPFFVGNLTIAVDLGILSAQSGQQVPTSMTVSPEISLQHRMSLLGGFNTLALQWGMGTLSSLNAYPADNASSGAWQWRIVEWLVFEPIPQLSGMFVFTYQDKNKVYENPTPNAGNASGVNWAGDSSRSWTLGVRPVWNVMNYFKLQADLGYQSVTPKVAYASGGPYSNTDTRTMFKAAIAPTFAPLPGPGGSFFVRPELRVFMAWATWNDAAQAAGAMGQGSCAATNTSGSVFGCSTNGFTFGAQVEAWW
jgi:maltoporin